MYAGQVHPSQVHDTRSSSPSTSSATDDQDDDLRAAQGPWFPGAFPFHPRPPTPIPPPLTPAVTIKTTTTTPASTPPPPPQPQLQQKHLQPHSPPQQPFHVDLPPPPAFHVPPPTALTQASSMQQHHQLHMDTPVLELWDPMDTHQFTNPAGAQHHYEFINNSGELDMSGGIFADDMYFDDEGLGTLEKIYLFARSRANFHRLFISRSLPNFLPDLTPHEAVEYVLPLLNSLGTDPEESVREAFVSELVPTVWWFYTNCQLVEDLEAETAALFHAAAQAAEPSPDLPVEPERDQQQEEQPSTSSSIHQSSNIAAEVVDDVLDHDPLHSSNDGGDGEMADAASIPPPTQMPSLQPTMTGEAPNDPNADPVARPPHAPTDEPPPLLPVQVFTPLFAALLLSPNNTLSDGSRAAVVELLRRLRDGYGLPQPPTGPGPGGGEGGVGGTHEPLTEEEMVDSGRELPGWPFGRVQRQLLEREFIMGLAIGMARMDEEGRNFVVLSTENVGATEDLGMHDLGGEAQQEQEPIPQVGEDGEVLGVEDEREMEGELGGAAQGVGLGIVSPVVPETSLVEERDGSPPLFEEEPPRVRLPESSTSLPQAEATAAEEEDPKTSPTIAVIAPPAESPSSSPSPPTQASPRDRRLQLSPKLGRTNSPSLSFAPISATAHLSHLSPSGSRSASPTRSPLASAPHTPPSPTIRPVRLPSTESARSVRIPGTPMEVLEHEDVLGLDTEAASIALVEVQAESRSEVHSPVPLVAEGLLGIPLVPEPVLTPGPEPSFPALPAPQPSFIAPLPRPAAAETSLPAPFADVQGLAAESIFRRPILSPVQPPSASPRPPAPQPQQSRTMSYSSEKSESTPTEGSSGETVTPSGTPSGSPTRSRSMEDTRAEVEDVMSSLPSIPPNLEFKSVPVEPPMHTSTVSPGSTDTSPSTSSTDPRTGFSMETISSEASTVSGGTIDTRSSSSESVPVHTPEGPMEEDDAGQIVAVDEEELEPGRSADHLGFEESDQNPFFLAASTRSVGSENSVKSSESDTVTAVSERPPSQSPTALMGSRGVGSTWVSPEVEEPVPTSTTPPPVEFPTVEPSVNETIPARPPFSRNRSGSFSGSSSTTFAAEFPTAHQRAKSVGRPDFVALPPRGTIDSPYPSPPVQDSYAVPPIDFGSLLAAQLASSASPQSTSSSAAQPITSPPPESASGAIAGAPGSPVARLLATQASATSPSPDLADDISQMAGNGSADAAAWMQVDNGGAVEEPMEYDGTHDAAVGRVASMSLIAAITAAGILSDESKTLFSQEVVKVGQDPVYWVRREAAFALGALAKTVSLELLTGSLLPLYEGMTCDEVANVRQSALFALPGILDRLPSQHRREISIKQCAALSHDSDRLVRSALLEIMGEMIYCFRDDEGGPPSQLIELFVGNNEHVDDSWVPVPEEEHQWGLKGSFQFGLRQSAGASSPPLRSMFEGYNDPSSSQFRGLFGLKTEPEPLVKARDPDRVLICAFNFPAVVAAMGPQRWSELRPYYKDLVRDSATKVRKTLAASIGEIARMIGPEHAGKDLVDVWWDLMHDENAEVRAKVVGCVAAFVTALGPEERRRIGIQLEGLWATALTGWKDREALAVQFGELSALLTPHGRAGSIKTLLISALTDRTAAVRDAAVTSCPQVMEGLAEAPDVHETAIRDIDALASDPSFRRRAVYVAAIQTLLLTGNHPDAFEDLALQKRLAGLSEDKVVDVRIGLARFMSLACARYFPGRLTRPTWLKPILRRLSRDESAEVKAYVSSLARPSQDIFIPPTSRPNSPTQSPFATFSRPPASTPLFSDPLDDLVVSEDVDAQAPDAYVAVGPAVLEASTPSGTTS